MNRRFFSLIRQCVDALYQAANRRLRQWTRLENHTLLLNVATGLARSKSELVLENVFLRQQLITLQRQAPGADPTRPRVACSLGPQAFFMEAGIDDRTTRYAPALAP